MFAATSKCILLLILNVFIVFMFTPAVWRVCKENEEYFKTIHQLDLQQEPAGTTTPPRRHRDVNVTVTHVEPTAEDDPSVDDSYEAQPSYNPHLTNPRKQETHF